MPEYTLYYTMHPDDKVHERIAVIIKSDIEHYEILASY